MFYRGHEGGFAAEGVIETADALDRVAGARFSGITTFPALLFDTQSRKLVPTANFTTLERARAALAKAGRSSIEINAPGTSSTVAFSTLANAGANKVEPGHGLTGTTPMGMRSTIYPSGLRSFMSAKSLIIMGAKPIVSGAASISILFSPHIR